MTEYKDLFAEGEVFVEGGAGALSQRFGLPPFTVLDCRSGEWQARKIAWLSLGIRSEIGRGENLLKFSDTVLEPDAKKRAKKAASFNTGGPGTLQGEFKNKKAIPGGGSGKNSAWLFKTDKGYKRGDGTTGKQTANLRGGLTFNTTTDPYRSKQSASHKNGLSFGTTIHPYDGTEGGAASQTGTSIFDPVLCEMFYRWFVPKGGQILDPFAGGSVRGIVASRLGFKYLGCDLRKEQIDANKQQAKDICEKPMPGWVCCDARDVANVVAKESQDAVFSCPPYWNLEQYSDDPADLSNLSWNKFCDAYEQIIKASCSRLKKNRFAAFVVGEVRDKKNGYCAGLVPETIYAFEQAGLRLYNDAVLITAVGSLSIRVGKQFSGSRKLGRSHQYCLIFCKGDPHKATEAIEGSK